MLDLTFFGQSASEKSMLVKSKPVWTKCQFNCLNIFSNIWFKLTLQLAQRWVLCGWAKRDFISYWWSFSFCWRGSRRSVYSLQREHNCRESMEDECTHRSPVTMSVSMFSSLSITLLSEFCHNKTLLTRHINEKWHFTSRHRPPQSAAGMNQALSEIKPKLTELFQALADVRWTIFFSIVNVRRGALNSSLCAIVLLCLRGNCVLMRWTHERDFKSKLSWAGVCCLACASVF